MFELGSLLCGVATSSKMLIVGRAVSGIGGAGLMNGGLVIVTACVPRHKAPSTCFLYFIRCWSNLCGIQYTSGYAFLVGWR